MSDTILCIGGVADGLWIIRPKHDNFSQAEPRKPFSFGPRHEMVRFSHYRIERFRIDHKEYEIAVASSMTAEHAFLKLLACYRP